MPCVYPGTVVCPQHDPCTDKDCPGHENFVQSFCVEEFAFDDDAIWMNMPKYLSFINTTRLSLEPRTPDSGAMSTPLTDSPELPETRPSPPWHIHNDFDLVTKMSATGPATTSTGAPFYYPSDVGALPSLMEPAPTSLLDTPLSPPPWLCNKRKNAMVFTASTASSLTDSCLNSPYDAAGYMYHPASIYGSRHPPPGLDVGMSTRDDREIDFLLQWFSEGPGCWMDLFDLSTYFASHVPVQARESPLLRYAAAACAAKSLARVQDCKLVTGGSATLQVWMQQHPDASTSDWKHKAAVYYDTAISLLLHALQMVVGSSADGPDCELWQPDLVCDEPASKRRRASHNTSLVPRTDELLTASAIICVYESLDTSVQDWSKHLAGARSLLANPQQHVMPCQGPTPPSSVPSASFSFTSKARRATFWNIARQDMLAAFIDRTNTRLDTEDLSLWREAGLGIDDQGYIMPGNTTACGFPEGHDMPIEEDLICNGLVWLMAKLVNFTAASDEVLAEAGMARTGVPQRTVLDRWFGLQKQFQIWHDGLLVTFPPSTNTPLQASGPVSTDDNASLFTEVSYSTPMYASTMQAYHMSQILLYMNKPHESTQRRSTVVARMNSYQSILATCQKHSREIVSISLTQSDTAARIHSVQPLFTAGQCLSNVQEREVVLNLLRGIQSDTGWDTNYRVCHIIEQWQEEGSKGPMSPNVPLRDLDSRANSATQQVRLLASAPAPAPVVSLSGTDACRQAYPSTASMTIKSAAVRSPA
ncbi:c6 zinc finger-like protein [Alternaria alternata]|nr:c6 zinc finger-like protein [Alternaria alternata]